MEYYCVALELLSKNTSVEHSGATTNLVSHLAMMAHNNAGQICYCEDDEENSMLHFEAAVFWAKQIYGVSHEQEYTSIFGTILSNYCRSQWIHGNVDEATYHAFETVLALRVASLPADHADVACAHYNLGAIAFARHLDDIAKTHLQEYLTIAEKVKDVELDPVPAMTLQLLLQNRGKKDKISLELNRALNALQEKREEYGATHMEVASLLNYIGTLLFHRKELRTAILFYREELRLEKSLMNAEAGISICVTYNNIGRILQELGELTEAIGCYRNALKADIDDNSYVLAASFAAGTGDAPVPPGNDLATPSTTNLFSTIWYNLGLIHDKMGARREAIMSFQMALGLRRRILGADHPDIACLWYNIGTLQMEINRLDDAIASFNEALRIRRLGNSREDPKHILSTLKKLTSLHQTRGNIDDALATLAEILQIQESSVFDLQWKTPFAIGSTLRKIADLNEAKGDLNAALSCAERSYLAFKSSGAFMQRDAMDHLKAVEEVARSLLMLGSLFNEICEPVKAQAAHDEAQLIIATALHVLGVIRHPVLQPLLGACTLQSCSGCAPVA
jgi:tetratricopeptide (TPR) repeat protein